MEYDPGCQRCPRLVDYLREVRQRHTDYHAAPVAPFGPRDSRLLIVGLAPGLHGANRTGRPFTGDASGVMLYRALAEWGFSSAAQSISRNDGLRLYNCRITNAVKCVPPGNRPMAVEVNACNPYLRAEIDTLWRPGVRRVRCILALGAVAHGAVVKALEEKPRDVPFAHNALAEVRKRLYVLSSYHPSRLNVATKRMDYAMLFEVIGRAHALLTD